MTVTGARPDLGEIVSETVSVEGRTEVSDEVRLPVGQWVEVAF